MTATLTEQVEAFNLGGVLARIEASQAHHGKTIDKIDVTVTDTSSRLGLVEVTLGRQAEQIGSALHRIDVIEKRDEKPKDIVTREEYNLIRAEVTSGRLSWPKVGALIGALASLAGFLAWLDGQTPAS